MKKVWLRDWPWKMLRKLPPVNAHAFRSIVGHYIAGTAGNKELDKVLAEVLPRHED